MLHLILGTDWTANTDYIMQRMGEEVRSRRPGRILLVPELISHETERRLCAVAGDTASRYAEVLSFSRLAVRVSDYMGSALESCLDNGGRLVAMAASARQLSSRLKAYASVETRPEFLSGLVDAVDEFKRCCIQAGDLDNAAKETGGSLAQKLEELSLLMEAYDTLCSRGKRDPRDQMTMLLELMELGSFGEDHVFFIDGFPDFTRQHMAILEHLIKVSEHVTVSLNCDAPDSGQLSFEKAGSTASQLLQYARRMGIQVQIHTVQPQEKPLGIVREKIFQGKIPEGAARESVMAFRTETAWDECMAAAREVRSLVQKGFRYRDISLVCTDMGVYKPLCEFIFHRMDIPLYASGTEDILNKSVVCTVLSALDAALEDFDQRSILRYLRSGLSPLSLDQRDALENYIIIWGIRGAQWLKPWEYHPEGLGGSWDEAAVQALQSINESRLLVCEPLDRLRQGFREAIDMKGQVNALFAFLEQTGMEEKLDVMARELDLAGENREAQILNQLWDILIGALEQLYDVLGDTWWDAEHFSRLLKLLLSQYDVGTIPPVLDAVHMGLVSAMRCHQRKHLIILGTKEGSFPGYPGSTGVLTDQERITLRSLGVPLTGGAMEGIQAEFAEIYGVVCGAGESIRVLCSGDQPSFLFKRLALLAGGEQTVEHTDEYFTADPWDVGAWLAGYDAGEEAQRLGVAQAYRNTCHSRDYSLGTVSPEQIRRLYGATLNLSASQVDTQAECRMAYFLKYGLRIRERKEAAVDPAEFGTYVHAVLENTARAVEELGGFPKVTLEETMALAHRFSDEYARERFGQLDSERVIYLFRRNMQELDAVVTELWKELRQSAFQPRGYEVDFGNSGELPPIAIPNGAMNAIVRGFVDRVDTWSNGYCTYYRVVDYKTGKKDFDYCDVFNGVGLQMLLYLFALKNSGAEFLGEKSVGAGVQYFPARSGFLSTDGALTREQTEKEREKERRRKGILLRDPQVLQAMEPGEHPFRCYTLDKNGDPKGDLAEREQLELLEKYIYQILAHLVEEIASGNVEPNPYTRGASHNACTFCPYGSVCRKDSITGRRNYEAVKPDRFWEDVEREVSRHGR